MLFALLIACSSPDAATETLQKSGYTDIVTDGWTPFACSEDDTFTTAFTATNPAGQKVEGVVCCGLLKSCTVRF